LTKNFLTETIKLDLGENVCYLKKLFLTSILLFVLISLPLISLVGASSEMWSQTYGGTEGDYAHSLVETSDGGYALAGITRDDYGFDIDCLLVKTDAYGNMEWNQTYGGEDSYDADAVVQTGDGGFVIAGDKYSIGEGYDSWLAKTDAYGNMEWNKTYSGASIDHATSLVETPDGGYAIAGYTTFGAGDYDFWLIKTDEHGNVEWNQTYGGADHEYARSLVKTSDGGFALAGTSGDSWVGQNEYFWLVKTDAYGKMEWNQTYGEGSASSLVETSDGGYALAGYSGSLDIAGKTDFWLAKTDAQGIPEFPSWVILPLLLTATLLILICKQRLPKTTN